MAAIWQAAVWCVLSTAGSETVLLDFYADWCGPCRAMNPVLEQLAKRGYAIRKINIDHHPDIAARFGVRAVPCFVMLVNGREVGREIGQVSFARLEQLCLLGRQNLSPSSPVSKSGLPVGGSPPEGPTVLQGFSGSGSRTASPRSSMTKDGLPIPLVELGIPRDPAAQAAATSSQESLSSLPPNEARAPSLANGTQGDRSIPSASLPNGSITEQELLASTVRLRVSHGESLSHGSGTIIDARQGEALILTCGHLFRESQGNGRIEVELFTPTGIQKTSGRLIAWNDHRDLGLVSIVAPGPVRAARVAPVGYPIKKGQIVFSVGCDHGQDPTVRKTWIVSINRYLGSPNLQVADQPVSGRSGGGLFTQEGYLIGVCNAADPADREGLFSSLPAIHAQLDEAHLQFVYQQPPDLPSQMPRPNPSALVQTPPSASALPGSSAVGEKAEEWASSAQAPSRADPAGLTASTPGTTPPCFPTGRDRTPQFNRGQNSLAGVQARQGSSEIRPGRSPLMELAAAIRSTGEGPSSQAEGARFPLKTVSAEANAVAQSPSPAPSGGSSGTADRNLASANSTQAKTGGLRPEESALLEEIARRYRQGSEVIFIVRPSDPPQAKSEIFVLRQASPEFLARLSAIARSTQVQETSFIVEGNPGAGNTSGGISQEGPSSAGQPKTSLSDHASSFLPPPISPVR